MVRVDRTPVPPASLSIEKGKVSGVYNKKDVIDQLMIDFNKKCYICELDELQSIEVEHLHPHNGDADKKFAWDNLFLSCPHCNSVKNQSKYNDKILDCCKEEPEAVLKQIYQDHHVTVECIGSSISSEAEYTAMLIMECFEKVNTGIREYECMTRVHALDETMTALYNDLEKYKTNKSARNLRSIKAKLRRTYRFSGFTRTHVREHHDEYPELAEYVML